MTRKALTAWQQEQEWVNHTFHPHTESSKSGQEMCQSPKSSRPKVLHQWNTSSTKAPSPNNTTNSLRLKYVSLWATLLIQATPKNNNVKAGQVSSLHDRIDILTLSFSLSLQAHMEKSKDNMDFLPLMLTTHQPLFGDIWNSPSR